MVQRSFDLKTSSATMAHGHFVHPPPRRGPRYGASAPLTRTIDALDFMRVLWALDHALQSKSKRMLSTHGVTGPQRLVLRALGRRPGMAAGELAELLHLHPSTLTGVLSRLVDRGLLLRSGDPSDSRRALFRLTARGRGVDRVTAGTVEAGIRRLIDKLPAARLSATVEVLAALAAELAMPDGQPSRRVKRVVVRGRTTRVAGAER